MRPVALYEMLFGLFTLAGGIIGFATAGSVVSLAAGSLTGLVLIFAGLAMQKGSRKGLYVALAVSLLLAGYFGYNFFVRSAAFMPAGIVSIMGLLSLVFLVLLLVQPKERKRIF